MKELSLPPVKIHCSVLAEDAIRAAIGDWKKKNSNSSGVELQIPRRSSSEDELGSVAACKLLAGREAR